MSIGKRTATLLTVIGLTSTLVHALMAYGVTCLGETDQMGACQEVVMSFNVAFLDN